MLALSEASAIEADERPDEALPVRVVRAPAAPEEPALTREEAPETASLATDEAPETAAVATDEAPEIP